MSTTAIVAIVRRSGTVRERVADVDSAPMLVTPGWLSAHLADPDLVVVDLRWDEQGRGRARYAEGHIAGAVHVDWASDLVDDSHEVAFMLAPPAKLANMLASRGIGDETVVVAYADAGHSGPFRLWWACAAYGHPEQVRVLDGGLDAWLAEGRPLTTAVESPSPAVWTPYPQPAHIASVAEVAAARDDGHTIVLDSRDDGHFRGETVWFETGAIRAEDDGIARTPRGELRAGHVPWAASVPWQRLYRPDGTMKSPDELSEVFAEVGAISGRRAIVYCGVGISASAMVYALRRAGLDDTALYDAGWDEWGRDPDLPVARGS
jgi:thiosulfate/3-mercaptopyruvate sulfurtransferase